LAISGAGCRRTGISRRSRERSAARPPAKPLAEYAAVYADRDEAIATAYASGGYTLKEIGAYFGLHYARVSRIVQAAKKAKDKT
jgi:hypothetical protein